MQVLVTGASGFLGRHILRHLLADETTQVIASDLTPCPIRHQNLTDVTCDLMNSALHDAVRRSDAVVHLAAMLGGAAEADPTAAFETNVTASLALMAACRPATRFVFASSIAVMGSSAHERAPVMTYGAHKAMVEIALETATRRGDIDGMSLRPGGIVARPDANPALKSAFLSRLFWNIAAGKDMTLPVTEEASTWLASAPAVAAQFCHAISADLGPERSLTLPMTKVRIGDLVAAVRAAYPGSQADVAYAPDPDIMALFGQPPPFDFQQARALGFAADIDLATLVRAAMTAERCA